MFKSKDSKTTPATDAIVHSHNSLVKGTMIEGQVKSSSDIRIDGTIKGSLECKAKVVIGTSGFIEGQIICESAVILGRVEGNISVAETLKLEKSGKVNGEITTMKFIVAPGAVFNGTCKMGKQDANGFISNSSRKGKSENVQPLQKEAIQ